jgi:hypothetical protein
MTSVSLTLYKNKKKTLFRKIANTLLEPGGLEQLQVATNQADL